MEDIYRLRQIRRNNRPKLQLSLPRANLITNSSGKHLTPTKASHLYQQRNGDDHEDSVPENIIPSNHYMNDHRHLQATVSGCSLDSTKDVSSGSSVCSNEKSGPENSDDGNTSDNCIWNTEEADLFIRVEESLFPVHKQIISAQSTVLKRMIRFAEGSFREDEEERPVCVITLPGTKVQDVKELLSFIYFRRRPIQDSNVLQVLRLANDFMVQRLKDKCETFLLRNRKYHPIDLLHVASRYNLPRLQVYSLRQAGQIPDVSQCYGFEELELSLQMRLISLKAKSRRSLRNTNGRSLRRTALSRNMELMESVEDLYDADSETGKSDEETEHSSETDPAPNNWFSKLWRRMKVKNFQL